MGVVSPDPAVPLQGDAMASAIASAASTPIIERLFGNVKRAYHASVIDFFAEFVLYVASGFSRTGEKTWALQ
jgi:hypothetical protein